MAEQALGHRERVEEVLEQHRALREALEKRIAERSAIMNFAFWIAIDNNGRSPGLKAEKAWLEKNYPFDPS